MHFYAISGLTVGSAVGLPGLHPAPRPAAPEVTIRYGCVPTRLGDIRAQGPTWTLAADELVLRVPDIARFHVIRGSEIVVEAEGGSAQDIAAFIIGTVFGILLHMRGAVVLNASAVRVNGKAVLFAGVSGSGKSTLAAALTQRGYPLLADDICVLTLEAEGRATVPPDGRVLRLWSQAIDCLKLGARRGARLRDGIDKFSLAPASCVATALPLGAIYMLIESRGPRAPGITRPNVVDAALMLRRCAYRPALIGTLEQRPLYLRAAGLANHAGFFHLARPFTFRALPDTLAWLEQHWRETGVTKEAA